MKHHCLSEMLVYVKNISDTKHPFCIIPLEYLKLFIKIMLKSDSTKILALKYIKMFLHLSFTDVFYFMYLIHVNMESFYNDVCTYVIFESLS